MCLGFEVFEMRAKIPLAFVSMACCSRTRTGWSDPPFTVEQSSIQSHDAISNASPRVRPGADDDLQALKWHHVHEPSSLVNPNRPLKGQPSVPFSPLYLLLYTTIMRTLECICDARLETKTSA